MSFFVQSIPAPAAKTTHISKVSIALAAVFIVLAVAQLYSYEEYPTVIASLWLPGGVQFAHLFAGLIVALEVAAVPFLFMMRLSPVMRIVSMASGWLVVATWLVVSLWLNITVNAVTNSGIMGATIPVAPGWWMTAVFIALGALVAWVSWGLWPLGRQSASK